MTDKIKLSEAMKLGFESVEGRQCTGYVIRMEPGSFGTKCSVCALGAAAIHFVSREELLELQLKSLNSNTNVNYILRAFPDHLKTQLSTISVPIPAGERVGIRDRLDAVIIYLNDTLHWSVDQIIRWVKSLEEHEIYATQH